MKIIFLRSCLNLYLIITLLTMILINFTVGKSITNIPQIPQQDHSSSEINLHIEGKFTVSNNSTLNSLINSNDKHFISGIPANYYDKGFNLSCFSENHFQNLICLKNKNNTFECLEMNLNNENIMSNLYSNSKTNDIQDLSNNIKISINKINSNKLLSELDSFINGENSLSSKINLENDFLINGLDQDTSNKNHTDLVKYLQNSLTIPNKLYCIFQILNETNVEPYTQNQPEKSPVFNLTHIKYSLEDYPKLNHLFQYYNFLNQAQYLKVFSKIVFVVMVIFLFN